MKKNLNWNKYTYNININFFKEHSPQMAYVLGFITSDGNIHKTTLSFDIQKRDVDVLTKINSVMTSDYLVKENKNSVRLRINNTEVISDLFKLGITPNKSKTVKFPNIPKSEVRHFIRGVLDGDGWISFRSTRREFCVGFSSGSYSFLDSLVKVLNQNLKLTHNNLRKKTKISKKGINSVTWQIEWYGNNAMNIIKFLYDNLTEEDLYLNRKYTLQNRTREMYLRLQKERGKSVLWLKTEKGYNLPMKEIIYDLHVNKGLDGTQMANILNVHSSSIYRWLNKTGVKKPLIERDEYEK